MATAVPITVAKVDGLGFPTVDREKENSGETFNKGVPLTFGSDGMLTEVSDPLTETVAGISVDVGANLSTDGVPKTLNIGSPQGQSSAVIIPPGAPLNDGRTGFYHADGKTVFRAALLDGQTFTDTLIDPTNKYELSRTANGYWAVDSTDTGSNPDNLCQIVGEDDTNDEFVYFRFHRLDGGGGIARMFD